MDILALNHNFSKEIESSTNKLFIFFCNNVKFGQWQLSKICLKQLIEEKKTLSINFDEIFWSIIKNPEIYWYYFLFNILNFNFKHLY